MKKIQIFFSLFAVTLLAAACASDNFTDKYAGGGGDPVDNPIGKLAHFKLDGTLENSEEESDCRLFLYGEELYSESAGVDGSQALKLNGKTNYLAVPIGEHDTLSVVFWARMADETFRALNAEPVWLDYGAGAVSFSLQQSGALEIDGRSEATKLKVTDATGEELTTHLLPAGEYYYNICTWDNKVFFYAEITSDYIKFRVKTKYADKSVKDYNSTIDKSQSPIETKPEWLYIGRPSGLKDATGRYLEGIIDDIHIYNRGLTTEEVEVFAQISIE